MSTISQSCALTWSIEDSKDDVSIHDDIKSWENFMIISIISGLQDAESRKNSSFTISAYLPCLLSRGSHYDLILREFTYNSANSNNNSCHAFIINFIRNVLLRMIILITE